ncbi:MAG: PAS domain S-box protein [Pyrinomonadaceae bacterium]
MSAVTVPLPPNEAARLMALRQYQLLDTQPEQAFDDLTRLAAHICQTPAAVITLIDEHRQWFKSRFGLNIEEAPRGHAMCSHTILQTEVMIVSDATADERFAANPYVVGAPHIRFYAGAPLVMLGGHAIGTLAVIDFHPRELNAAQTDMLQALSRQVVALLELRRNSVMLVRKNQELADSEGRYRALVEQASDGIVVTDLEGRLLEANTRFCEMLGYTREQLAGLGLHDIIPPEDLQADPLRAEELRAGKVLRAERRMRRGDGGLIAIETGTKVIGEGLVQTILHDVTEHKKLETQLRQAQKMEAVGRLAGGVAHDFNNVLQVITGYGNLLLKQPDLPARAGQRVEEILGAADRAAALTEQLLAFSRQQVIQPRVLNLNHVIEDLDKMLRRAVTENIEVETLLEPALRHTKADPNQMQQILLNLMVNARDASPPGSRVRIMTANFVSMTVASHPSSPDDIPPGQYVALTVADEGHGMTPETLANIFEPFYTTKEKGTGMGLATVYGIVQQAKGYIRVESEPGRGTIFRIYFPRTEDVTGAAEGDGGEVESELLTGAETILLVEDEETVRLLAREVLEMCGYHVLEARDGEEALDLCRQYESEIHLALTDIVLPRMGGHEFSKQLVEHFPDIRIIYMSGYTDDEALRHGVVNKDVNFLQKPFTLEELAGKVRAVLDEK